MSDVFDIALIGTSLITSAKDRGWALSLAAYLQSGKRERIRTYTFGGSGQTSNWGLANIGPVIQRRPRVALIEFMNDAHVTRQAPNPENMTLALSTSNFNGMIDAIQAGSPDTAIFLVALIRPLSEPTLFPSLATYFGLLPGIAASKGVGFIDCYAPWGDPALRAGEFEAGDDIHPLLSGYLRASIPTIAASLSPLIK